MIDSRSIDADELPVTSREVETLIQSLAVRAHDDPHVVAAWLEGWDPRRAREATIDFTVWLSCDTKEYGRSVARGIRGWMGGVAPLVLVKLFDGGGSMPWVHVVTRQGIRVGIWTNHAEFARRRPIGRVLKETPGHFTFDPDPPYTWRPPLHELADAVEAFWMYFHDLPHALEHGQVVWAYAKYLGLLRRAADVIAHRPEHARHRPMPNLTLDKAEDDLLASAIGFEHLTAPTIAREYLKLAALVQREAPPICQRKGVDYPAELEWAVVGRAVRDLRALGLMPEPSADERFRVRVPDE